MYRLILLQLIALILACQAYGQINLKWDLVLEGNGEESFNDVSYTDDGGCLLLASTFSTDGVFIGNHGGRDVYIAKYDSQGSLAWDYMFGGSADDNLGDIIPVERWRIFIDRNNKIFRWGFSRNR